MSRSVLFLASPGAFADQPAGDLDAAAAAFVARMHAAGVALVLLADDSAAADAARLAAAGVPLSATIPNPRPWSAKRLLSAGRGVEGDLSKSWLVCADAAAIPAAETAGLSGVILVRIDPPAGEHALVVARADSLGDVPRVLIPRGGGCWHDR